MKRIVSAICLACILTCTQALADNYDGAWNTPTIGTGASVPDLYHFGKIGYRDRSFREDALRFPAIQGLSHKSVYALCQKDTCFAEYAVLALRCPPVQTLLDWMSERVCDFANSCAFPGLASKNGSKRIKQQILKSADSICEHYAKEIGNIFNGNQCPGNGDSDSINEQNGLLMTDCWQSGPFYTFYEGTWYDMLSNGDTTQNSYLTIDSRTGKELTLPDFVDPANYDALSALMMPRLFNSHDELLVKKYSGIYSVDDKGVLANASGCALIREGLIIYFYPYNLASGADGACQAIIPYNKLEGILKIK